MKKMFIIFSLIVITIAGLFGGQILSFNMGAMSSHEITMGCEVGACDVPPQMSCAEHCFAAVVQDYALPVVATPLFLLSILLIAMASLVAIEIRQTFDFEIFYKSLNRRLALNVARRE